jgi:hypothetical protein
MSRILKSEDVGAETSSNLFYSLIYRIWKD